VALADGWATVTAAAQAGSCGECGVIVRCVVEVLGARARLGFG
jgi:hypothetical protein